MPNSSGPPPPCARGWCHHYSSFNKIQHILGHANDLAQHPASINRDKRNKSARSSEKIQKALPCVNNKKNHLQSIKPQSTSRETFVTGGRTKIERAGGGGHRLYQSEIKIQDFKRERAKRREQNRQYHVTTGPWLPLPPGFDPSAPVPRLITLSLHPLLHHYVSLHLVSARS